MNTLDKTEIVNNALAKAGKELIQDFNSQSNQMAVKGRLFYKETVQMLLGSYPWPQFTKTYNLETVAEVTQSSRATGGCWRYVAELPPNAAYVWDIFSRSGERPYYSALWDLNRVVGYSFPYSDYISENDNLGEIINGRFATNTTNLSVLYTPQDDIDPKTMSNQFVGILIRELKLAFETASIEDADLLKLKVAETERGISRMRTQAAIENRKGISMPSSQILDLVQSGLR